MSNALSSVGDVFEDVGRAIGTTLGLRDPYKKQKKELKKAEEEQARMAEEEQERRRKTQRAALQPSQSLFDILGGSDGA